jgi:hypothetical protein
VIEFNVTPTRTPHGHVATESLLERTSKWWTCSDEKLSQFGDVAFAVQANLVAGVYRIAGWRRDDTTGKVELFLEALPEDHPARGWLDHPAPVPWEPGQRQPFKYVSRKGLLPTPPTDVAQVSARRAIAQMARAASANLARIPNDMRPAFRLVRAYEIYRIVYSVLEIGTPLQGGPRLLPHMERFPHEFTVLERELALLVRQASSSSYRVGSTDAERCIHIVANALQKLAQLMATPSSGLDGVDHSVSLNVSEIHVLNSRYRHGSPRGVGQVFREELQAWVEANVHNYDDPRSLARAARAEGQKITDALRFGQSEDEIYRQAASVVQWVWDRHRLPSSVSKAGLSKWPQVPADD